MKFKLDENLGLLGKSLLEADGHNVMTVAEQRLSGAQDERIYEVCQDEGRWPNNSFFARGDRWHRGDRVQGASLAEYDPGTNERACRTAQNTTDRS